MMRKTQASPINAILKSVVARLEKTNRQEGEKILSAWKSIAGKKFSRQTKPQCLRKGTLWINVADSAWLYRLSLEKEKLLKDLKKRLGDSKICNIHFRIGDTNR